MQGLRRRMVLDLSSSTMVSGEVTWFIDLYTIYSIIHSSKSRSRLFSVDMPLKLHLNAGERKKGRKWCLKRKDSPLAVFTYDWVHESACISHQATHL